MPITSASFNVAALRRARNPDVDSPDLVFDDMPSMWPRSDERGIEKNDYDNIDSYLTPSMWPRSDERGIVTSPGRPQ